MSETPTETPAIRTPSTWRDRHGSTLVGALCFLVLALLIAMQVAC